MKNMMKNMMKTRLLCLLLLVLALAARPAFADNEEFDKMSSIGNAIAVHQQPDGVLIDCADHSQVKLQVLAPDLIRVRASFKKPIAGLDHSWAIAKTQWAAVPHKLSDSGSNVTLDTAEIRAIVYKAPLRVAFQDVKTGRLINADRVPMRYDESGGVAAAKVIGSEEHVYGLGEKAAHLDKRHDFFEMWSSDTPGYTWGTDPIYQSVPFYLGLIMDQNAGAWHGTAYGIFYDNSYHTYFDIASHQPEDVIFRAEGGDMNYYFFYGPSIKKILGRYTELTGRMPMQPKWALGHQQSRYSYANEQQVRDVVSRYRAEHIPLDVLHLDIHYMDGYRVFTWNPTRFPDPSGLIKWVRDQGVKVVTIVDPGVKYEPDGKYYVYNEGTANNYFLKHKDGNVYIGKVWPGQAVFVDYTIDAAAKWWGDLHKALLDQGVAGIWNDMNEPADFESREGSRWADVVSYDEGQHTLHAKNRNVFALNECRATYQGLQRLRPNERPYLITRSGYAGIQRWATMWTGDNTSTWSSMALSIPMFETLGLSGEAFVGSDCGGFMGRPDPELLTRWYEIGFLTPMFRNHHVVDNYDQEPWRFGKRYEDIIRKYVQMRYQFLPYLYTVMAEAHRTGIPWFRPLILEDQDDYEALNIDDEFMVGHDVLAAPILEAGKTSREVYLPRGVWYDYRSDVRLMGGTRVTVEAPLDRIPLFVRAGSIIPNGPVEDYVGQKRDDVTLQVYPTADGQAHGWLYQDDGVTPACDRGAYRETELKWNAGALQRTVRHDGFTPPTSELKAAVHGRG